MDADNFIYIFANHKYQTNPTSLAHYTLWGGFTITVRKTLDFLLNRCEACQCCQVHWLRR